MPINHHQLLYLKLMEECAEVAERASKLIQFGPSERQTDHPEHAHEIPDCTNRELLQREVFDLLAVIVLLGLTYPSNKQILDKAAKIKKYEQIAADLGQVEL